MSIDGPNLQTSSSLFAEGVVASPDALSPDSLMIYLQTRLESLDTQVTTIFDKQKHAEQIRAAITEIKRKLNQLNDDTSNKDWVKNEEHLKVIQEIFHEDLPGLEALDPTLGAKLREDLSREGYLFNGTQNGQYKTEGVANTAEYLDGITKQLDATSQMDMIHMQSVMSARATAIQLSTNLLSSIDKGPSAIAGNIGR